MNRGDHHVLLSGFADESALDKTMDQQLSVMAALGLNYFTIRFVDLGNGIKNVIDLDDDEIAVLRSRISDYGLNVSSIGSPIGKVKIADIEDDSNNRYVPFDEYLSGDVRTACRIANELDTKLIRGFSFYHPQRHDSESYFDQAIDQLGRITEICDQHGLTFGLEVETNLIGSTGDALARIHRAINHPALVLVFDGGNLVTQGFGSEQVLDQFRAMINGLGWLHVKDYGPSNTDVHSKPGSSKPKLGDVIIDEDALNQYVPADSGVSNYVAIFRELLSNLPAIIERNKHRGIPGFFVDLEPHLRGGGQFGGFSGPDGMGIALRSLCRVLDEVPLAYRLTEFRDL